MATTRKQLRLALEALTETESPKVPNKFRMEAAEVHSEARPWLREPGIQGFGIGPKIEGGEERDELALRVYVEKKKPISELRNPVREEVEVPGADEPILTDVEAIGKVRLELNADRVRPAQPGFGLGHQQVSVGTFGCVVRKPGEAGMYILSNSHILANEGIAEVGDKIVQPGVLDGGEVADDFIAELTDWVPFEFTSQTYPNLVDAALARAVSDDLVTSAIKRIGVPKGISTYVRRGMHVQKTGRTTDYTLGEIRDIDFKVWLRYKKPGGGRGRVGLRDQVLCTRYTDGGDSGSLVLNMSGMAVGLHFAGSSSASVFNRIGHVIDALAIELVTQDS